METKVRRAKWVLRLGLAAVFAYAAVAAIVTPDDWIGYLPHIATQLIPASIALALFSVFQLALAVWLLSGWLGRYAALVSAAVMVAIIFSDIHLFAITFRDIAIACAAVALALLS